MAEAVNDLNQIVRELTAALNKVENVCAIALKSTLRTKLLFPPKSKPVVSRPSAQRRSLPRFEPSPALTRGCAELPEVLQVL